MIGWHCSDPAPGYFLPSLDYFLYEAEFAAPQPKGSFSSSTTSSLVCNTSACASKTPCVTILVCIFIFMYVFKTNNVVLPRCEQYFRDQGFDFKLSNGRVVVVRRTQQLAHQRRRRQVSISGRYFTSFILFMHWCSLLVLQQMSIAPNQDHVLQVIPHKGTASGKITWTGLGWVRLLDGSGLRFTVDNLLSSMEVRLVIRYETEVRSVLYVFCKWLIWQ